MEEGQRQHQLHVLVVLQFVVEEVVDVEDTKQLQLQTLSLALRVVQLIHIQLEEVEQLD